MLRNVVMGFVRRWGYADRADNSTAMLCGSTMYRMKNSVIRESGLTIIELELELVETRTNE